MIKKIFILCLFPLCLLGQNEIKWYNINDAYQANIKNPKPFNIDVYNEWCGWCKRMDKDTYAKPNIATELNKNYVSVKFNPEVTGVTYTYNGKTYDGPGLAGAISNNSISGYPTTIFINPNSHLTKIEVGYKNEADMSVILVDIQKALAGGKKGKKK